MASAKFYARSLPQDADLGHWQELEAHLHGVANRAARFAEPFLSVDWACWAGLCHDVGKYQPEFQARLKGSAGSVEHSGAGAALACRGDKERGIPLAFVIAGHHAGLANLASSGPELATPLKERLAANGPRMGTLLPLVPRCTTELPVPPWPDFLRPRPNAGRAEQETLRRTCEFWIRFLFSCVVDADRLDAEEFMTPDVSRKRAQFALMPELRTKLDRYIDTMVESLPRAARLSPVNRARAEVLSACRAAARESPGFFSLTVPTGGGKTLSSMSFALRHAEQHGLRRVVVVIPYTSIIEQNAEQYRKALGAGNVIEHHCNLDPTKLEGKVGEEVAQRHDLACENWDAPVIVTTTVQFFESLFSNRPSSCRKLHNIARSVIILDEVQTLPPGYLLCILDALSELVSHYGCSVVLSTATPPALKARERFEAGLRDVREIVPSGSNMAAQVKRVEYAWPHLDEEAEDWDALAAEMAPHHQVLAVVHKRADACTLAMTLQGIVADERVLHLSALMCPAHRSDTLATIKATLAQGGPCRVVSTQLVEAGVDVDFPVVYRALAGLDSIVQAAGRCNREGRLARGQVVVFRAPTSPPQGTPKRGMEITESLLRETGSALDPDDPALFERYFRMLYFAETLDAAGIQVLRQEFNFATVAREFKLIEDGFTRGIVVPYGPAQERIEALRREGPARDNLRALRRALQPFIVSIYPKAFDDLLRAGAMEQVAEGVYALSQVHPHLYDNTFGLALEEPPNADPEALIK